MLRMAVLRFSCGTPVVSHTAASSGGQAPVSASALNANTRTSLRDENGNAIRVDTTTPRALELDEIPGIVNDFRQAVANAREAGFDWLSCTLRTVTCCISSCPRLPTSVPTSTAAALKTARVWCLKWWMLSVMSGAQTALVFVSPRSVLSRTSTTVRTKKQTRCI